MKSCCCMLACLSLLSVCAEIVRMDFDVCDVEGRPIKGALVRIHTNERALMPYQKVSKKKMSCTTDRDGKATERFSCWDGDVDCYFSADGYYPESARNIFFKSEYDQKSNKVVFSEDYKKLKVCLYPTVNPIGLYAYRALNRRWNLGVGESCIGYDLRLGDWLPPRGKGEVADFYLYHRCAATNGVVFYEAKMTFDRGCGAYIVKRSKEPSRTLVYAANAAASYESEIVSLFSHPASERRPDRTYVLNNNDALVIRSRAEFDSAGRVVKANYSKIYGPFSIAGVFEFGQVCFNPTPNDMNLEFDTHRNLADKNTGIFYP